MGTESKEGMLYLHQTRFMNERVALARKALESIVQAGDEFLLTPSMSAQERVAVFCSNASKGYLVVPDETVFTKNEVLNFSLKRGPFVDYLQTRDLRGAAQAIRRLSFPKTGLLEGFGEVPAQTVGVRFGMNNFTIYSADIVDLIGSQLTYESLRKQAKSKRKEKGNIKVSYGEGIELTIHGLLRGRNSILTAILEGFPSREQETVLHNPQYKLETIFDRPATGVFNVTSGYQQHGIRNWVVFKHFNGHLNKDEPEKVRAGTIDVAYLGLGDLVGLRMIEAIAKKQYGVELNSPLPRFPPEMIAVVSEVGNRAIIVNEEGKRRKPNKREWSALVTTILSANDRAVVDGLLAGTK